MQTPLTDEWIEEQLELCEKATRGPWAHRKGLGCKEIGPRTGVRSIYGVVYTSGLSNEAEDRANAQLCAAAREGYSLVLKEMQRLRRVIWSAHDDLMECESGHAAKTLDDDREPGTKSYYE